MTIQNSLSLMASLSLSAALLTAAPGLSITSPADGSSAAPGQTLAIIVTPSGSFTRVVVLGAGPIGYSSVLTPVSSVTPYQFSLPIPAGTSPGRYSLTALGVSSAGNTASAAITISVERPDPPVQIDVTPATLDLPVGARNPLRVIGTYADGTQLDITHSSSTTYSSTDPSVATVDSQSYVTAVTPSPVVLGQLQLARIVVNNSVSIPVFTPAAFSVAPEWPVLYGSQRTQFSAMGPGRGPANVKWTINPPVGSIDNSGVYTAPNKIASGGQTVMITATMRNIPSVSVTTGVALFSPVTISIDPGSPLTLHSGQTQRFMQSVNNALDNRVDWSISPKTLGSVSIMGLYTAPASVARQQTVVVTATSIADSSKSASVTLTLQP